jgi:hypothetical protein
MHIHKFYIIKRPINNIEILFLYMENRTRRNKKGGQVISLNGPLGTSLNNRQLSQPIVNPEKKQKTNIKHILNNNK